MPTMQIYHQKYLGFEKALNAPRNQSSDSIQSNAVVFLLFAMETRMVSRSKLGWKDYDSRLEYVEFHAFHENYADSIEEYSFEYE